MSEEADIRRFQPRASPNAPVPVVWSVSEDRLHNYLLPRDCPRVAFWAGPNSTGDDISRFLGSARAIVAVEAAWRDRIGQARLHLYRMPAAGFSLVDVNAGYFTNPNIVIPTGWEIITDAPAAVAARGASLIYLPSLWSLHDSIAASSLCFSMIRMRNAQPRS